MADDQQKPSAYVTLVSNDGYEFIIERECADQSGTLKRMLAHGTNFAESMSGRCTFDEISGVVLEKVVEYLYYARKYAKSQAPPSMEIPPELCLELLVAADFLSRKTCVEWSDVGVVDGHPRSGLDFHAKPKVRSAFSCSLFVVRVNPAYYDGSNPAKALRLCYSPKHEDA